MCRIWLTGYSSVQSSDSTLLPELQLLLRPRRPEEVLRQVVVITEVVVVLVVVVVVVMELGSVIEGSSGSGPLA
jgi:hypothetical protein